MSALCASPLSSPSPSLSPSPSTSGLRSSSLRNRTLPCLSTNFAFSMEDRILIVGDGNCSFGAALCKQLIDSQLHKLTMKSNVPPAAVSSPPTSFATSNLFFDVHSLLSDEEKESEERGNRTLREEEHKENHDERKEEEKTDQGEEGVHPAHRSLDEFENKERKCFPDEKSSNAVAPPNSNSSSSQSFSYFSSFTSSTFPSSSSSSSSSSSQIVKRSSSALSSLSLSKDISPRPPFRFFLVSTYEDKEQLKQKYPESEMYIEKIQENGGLVLQHIDATNLIGTLKSAGIHATPALTAPNEEKKAFATSLLEFDRILFNFPHTGANYCGMGAVSAQEHLQSNQRLLFEFFQQCEKIVAKPNIHVLKTRKQWRRGEETKNEYVYEGKKAAEEERESDKEKEKERNGEDDEQLFSGKVYVTLKVTQPYTRWNIIQQAEANGLSLIAFHRFDPQRHLPLYSHRPAMGHLTNTRTNIHHAATFVFAKVYTRIQRPANTGVVTSPPSFMCEVRHNESALSAYHSAVEESQRVKLTYRTVLHEALMKNGFGEAQFEIESYTHSDGTASSLFHATLTKPSHQQISEKFPSFNSEPIPPVISPSLIHSPLKSDYWTATKADAREICAYQILCRMKLVDKLNAEVPATTLPDNIPAAHIINANQLVDQRRRMQSMKQDANALDDELPAAILHSNKQSSDQQTGDSSSTSEETLPLKNRSQFRCDVCNLDLNGAIPLQDHLKSAKHAKKVASLQPPASSSTGKHDKQRKSRIQKSQQLTAQQSVASASAANSAVNEASTAYTYEYYDQQQQQQWAAEQMNALAMQAAYAPMMAAGAMPMPMLMPVPMAMPMATPVPLMNYSMQMMPMQMQMQMPMPMAVPSPADFYLGYPLAPVVPMTMPHSLPVPPVAYYPTQ